MQLQQEVPNAEQGAAVITAIRGERGAPAVGDHICFSKLTRLLGTVPGWQISSELRQTQSLLSDPAQPACLGLWKSPAQEKRTLTPAFQIPWVKKNLLMRTLRFRVTDKPHKFQKNHGCTWLQLFSCWHPEQTPLLRSWPFSPECFRWPCQQSQVLSTEPQLQNEKTFQTKRDEKRPFSPTPISLTALCSYISKEVCPIHSCLRRSIIKPKD